MGVRLVTLAAIFLLAARIPASAQCTASDGVAANYSTVRLVLDNPGSMPAALQQGITAGAGDWNGAACNDGDDYPLFSTSGTFQPVVHISFDSHLSQSRDSNGNTVCGFTDYGGVSDGSNTTIFLFGMMQFANGTIVDCFPNSAIAEDSVAHELGHYLGLGNVGASCTDYIMGPRTSSIVNGQVVWNTSRQIQGAECAMADAMNTTQVEQNNEGGGSDPYCDAYCWTTCIGSYCPSGNPWCPILIDLENDGIHLTGTDDPVWFDIDGDGDGDLISWTDRSEGILALDRNGNGTIDDGGELFGNATRLANGDRAANGYEALAELDSWVMGGNGDGAIDSADAAFSSLWMWTDLNHDGISQPDELQTLPEAGIVRMDVDYKLSRRTDRYGNEFRYRGRAWKQGRNGVVHPVLTWDVFFVVVH